MKIGEGQIKAIFIALGLMLPGNSERAAERQARAHGGSNIFFTSVDLREHPEWIEVDEQGNRKRSAFWASEELTLNTPTARRSSARSQLSIATPTIGRRNRLPSMRPSRFAA